MSIVLKILFLPLAVVLMAVVALLSALEDYTDVLEKNWDLSLPSSDGAVYETDSGASFLGDGYRYHVLEYADGDALTGDRGALLRPRPGDGDPGRPVRAGGPAARLRRLPLLRRLRPGGRPG